MFATSCSDDNGNDYIIVYNDTDKEISIFYLEDPGSGISHLKFSHIEPQMSLVLHVSDTFFDADIEAEYEGIRRKIDLDPYFGVDSIHITFDFFR